jgi:hypothetical protein
MRLRSERGAALALVVIFAFVLSILAAAVYALFRSNVTTHQWNWERIQARYTAEAGCNLAVHMILGGSDVPQDSMPILFLPESGLGWYDLPGDEMGVVKVAVDPNDNNDQVSTGNAYGVRALGRVQGASATYDYGMETMVIPENFARFATFLNTSPMGGYYGDGYRFDGPFFCNGPVCVYSGSASSTNDIWFYRFTLASDFYYFSTGSASNPQTSPQVGNLTMQPIERMMLGAPHFELGVDPIPFGPDEVNWQDARDAAQSGGLYFAAGELPSGTRMIICQDTLFVKTSDVAIEQYFLLDSLENPVVWVNNGAGDILYIKSMPPYVTGSTPVSPNGLSLALTIGCNGTIRPLGPLQYQNRDLLDPDNVIMLGLLSVYGNLEIPYDPSIYGGADWNDPYKIVMDSDVEVDAVIMDLDGEFKAQNYQWPQPIEDFMIMGGYIVNDEGYTTWGSTGGWNTVIYYDTRLMTMHPPFFPQTGRWDVVYWEERPELDDHLLMYNRY